MCVYDYCYLCAVIDSIDSFSDHQTFIYFLLSKGYDEMITMDSGFTFVECD